MKTNPEATAKENAQIVRVKLPFTERLAQLAEEAAELSQAALKLRRAITGVNPTPVTIYDASCKLGEEIADVYACLDALSVANDPKSIKDIKSMAAIKMARWADRLSEKSNGSEEIE